MSDEVKEVDKESIHELAAHGSIGFLSFVWLVSFRLFVAVENFCADEFV